MNRRILSIGHNAAALTHRNEAIQRAGYQVTTTKETALLLEIVRKQDFKAVVLCNSIPPHLRESLAQELKRLKPKQPLIMICTDQEEEKKFQGIADHTVVAKVTGSQVLIDAINSVVSRAGKRTGTG